MTMKKVTLNHIVESVLQNTKRDYKILSASDKQVRFKIKCENVNLFGTVTPDSYTMNIKKGNGELVDEVTCSISHTDDIFKRINESLTTGEKLSKYVTAVSDAKKNYLTPGYVTEAKDEDEAEDKQILLDQEDDIDSDYEEEPMDLQSSLEDLIDTTLIMADDASNLIELVDGTENDTENKAELVAIMGSMYSLADDIQTLIDEVYPEPEEDIDESVAPKRKLKRDTRTEAINKLSEVSIMLRKEKGCKDIREAIKVIKSSLLLK